MKIKDIFLQYVVARLSVSCPNQKRFQFTELSLVFLRNWRGRSPYRGFIEQPRVDKLTSLRMVKIEREVRWEGERGRYKKNNDSLGKKERDKKMN